MHFWVVGRARRSRSSGNLTKIASRCLVLVRLRAWCVLRFSGDFWVLAENGFHGRMCLKGRNLRDFCESEKIGEKRGKWCKTPNPLAQEFERLYRDCVPSANDTGTRTHRAFSYAVRLLACTSSYFEHTLNTPGTTDEKLCGIFFKRSIARREKDEIKLTDTTFTAGCSPSTTTSPWALAPF